MAALGSQSIASSYEQLLHVDRNGGGNGTTLVDIKDGDNGTTFALQLATDKVHINGSLGIGVTDPAKALEIAGSGAEAELIYLTSTQSANTSNRVRQSHRLLSDSQERTSFSLLSGFNTITDGSRNSIVEFKTSNAGTFGTAMAIDGNSIGIGTDSPQKKVDIVDTYSTGGSSNEDLQLLIRGGNTDLNPVGDSVGLGIGYAGANDYVKTGIVSEFVDVNGRAKLHLCTSNVAGADTINKGDARLTILQTGEVGIGTASPDTNMHIHKASAGSVDSYSESVLTLENSGNTALNILSGNGNHGQIAFGDDGDNDKGIVGYDHGADVFYVTVNGVSTKRFKIDTNSRISLSNNNVSGATSNTIFGKLAGNDLESGGTNNSFFGENAGNSYTTGDNSVAIGFGAGLHNQTGGDNTYVGYGAGLGADGQNHSDNTAVGSEALSSITTGGNNVAIGRRAGYVIQGASGNTIIGRLAADALNANSNVVIGDSALGTATTATQNVAIGSDAMSQVPASQAITGAVAIGQDALKGAAGTTTGVDGTIAIGYQSLKALTSGTENIAIGYQAMTVHTSGSKNIAIGHQAMDDTDAGANSKASTNNIFMGYRAGSGTFTDVQSNNNTCIGSYTTGANLDGALDNTALGYNTFAALTSGDNNTAIGSLSGDAITTGSQCTAVGHQALTANQTGSYITAIGNNALTACTASENTAVGWDAGGSIVGGTSNVMIGSNAGDTLTSGNQNTCVGDSSDVNTSGGTNQTVIGYNAVGQGDNVVVLGDANVTHVCLGHEGTTAMAKAGGETIQGSGNETMWRVVNNTMAQNTEWDTGIDTSQSFMAFVGAIESDNTNGDTAIIKCSGGTIATVATSQGYIEVNSSSVSANRTGFYATSNTLRVKSTWANGIDVSIAIMSAT